MDSSSSTMHTQPHNHHIMGFTSFTISQAFLGAPLQFNPVLGSKELESLVDAYVPGPTPKADKLSEITIDFYKFATVDLNSGALIRKYNIFPSPYASSPSASAAFSPAPKFTPSPSSSGYNSSFVAQTPPTAMPTTHRARGSKVTKKPTKKQAKAATERLPGFSIMTKDGIDVTTSAGRGTKTKEQREHAHLMRIMKACDACKKKKVRCDPSHRRAGTEMSTSTSTKTSSPSKSPPSSTPSLTQQASFTSDNSMSSFAPNAINDFVLFPETPASEWNPADVSDPFAVLQGSELIDFDFDINSIGGLNNFPDQFFDFPSYDGETNFHQTQPFDYSPFGTDQYGLDQFDPLVFIPVAHTTSSHSSSSLSPSSGSSSGSGLDQGSYSQSDLEGSLSICHTASSHTSATGSPSDSQGPLPGSQFTSSILNSDSDLQGFLPISQPSSFQASSSGSPQVWSPDQHPALSPQVPQDSWFSLNSPSATLQQGEGTAHHEIPAALHWSISERPGDLAVDHISHTDPGDQVLPRLRHNRLDSEGQSKVIQSPSDYPPGVPSANNTEGSQAVVESLRSESNSLVATRLSTQPQQSSDGRYQSILANLSNEDRFSPHGENVAFSLVQQSQPGEDTSYLRQDRLSGEDNSGQRTLVTETQLRIRDLSEDHDHKIIERTSPQEARAKFFLPAPFDMGKIVRKTVSGQTSWGAFTATEILTAPSFAETIPESPHSVLCRTTPSLQSTVSPLTTIKPTLAIAAVAAYIGSGTATVAGMLLVCVFYFAMAMVAKHVLLSCMDFAAALISSTTASSMSGSSFERTSEGLNAGRRIVSRRLGSGRKDFGRTNSGKWPGIRMVECLF